MINACHHEQFASNENRFITVIPSTTLSLLVLKYELSIIVLKKVANNYPQKMKSYVKDFFSKLNQVRKKLRIWSYLPNKPLTSFFV